MNSISSMTSSLASNLFAKLDTKNQGYIEKSDLETALSSISSSSSGTTTSADDLFSALDSDSDGKVTESELTKKLNALSEQLDSQFNSARMSEAMGGMGGMNGMPPPPPPPSSGNDSGFTKDELTAQLSEIGSSDAERSSFISNVVNNFDDADSDGDGKVTFAEAKAYNESSSSTSTTSSTSTSSDFGLSQMAGNMPPPPPPPSSGNDSGFTKDELTAQLSEIASSDSERASFISNVVNNFDDADSDGDGKVTFAEAKAYNESSSATSTSSTSSTSTQASDSTRDEELAMMLKLMQLAQSYGVFGQDSSNALSSLSTQA